MWGATAIFAMLICQYYFQFVNIMISTLLQSIASASFHYRRLWSGMRGRLEVATLFVFVFVKQLTCHSSRRLGQTVPCPPRVRSLGAAQLGRSRTSSISTSTPSPDRAGPAGRGGGRLSSQATQRPGGDQARRHLCLGAPALHHYGGGRAKTSRIRTLWIDTTSSCAAAASWPRVHRDEEVCPGRRNLFTTIYHRLNYWIGAQNNFYVIIILLKLGN